MRYIVLALLIATVLLSCATSMKTAKNVNVFSSVVSRIDTSKKDTIKKIRPYNEVITSRAVTKKGFFKIHNVDERWYFEIKDSLLNKDFLIVNRISKAAAGMRPNAGFLGYAGDYIGENVVQFVKGPLNKFFIIRTSYIDRSSDSSKNGMYRSVLNSSLPTIVASFDIKTFTEDSTGLVIDMTDFLNKENDIFFFIPRIKNAYGLGAVQSDKSYVKNIAAFPSNIEIKTIRTYTAAASEQLLTYELNSSIVLLPEKPMKPRFLDKRVGYFSRGYRDFDAPQGVDENYIITRWRLEPKIVDIEQYKAGELVEPQKPIIFYIDPATPRKWVPYLIKGVNAWQKAFEKAGFKNAIYALEAPVNDSTWSLEDARHSAIVYKPSEIQNASGPQVSDPRSGEILESHVDWYHNVQQLLHDWYFIQASPSDPNGRKMQFDDSLMGQLIQYVCTHEVGHTLGLMHNFGASSTIPVDSLRSRGYVAQYGHTPSVMDYARFNYVAQPEDSIPEKDLIPRIGVYDEWAIEWGYKWLPDLKTSDEENTYLKQWIVQRQSKDKRLIFGDDWADLRNRPEDLGDDVIKANYYAIKNLKFVMAHLADWTKTANKDYSDLQRLSKAVFSQYALYMHQVLRYIGGQYEDQKTGDQKGPVWTFASKEKQQSAIRFLQDCLFDTPEWLFNKEVFSLSGLENVVHLWSFQEYELYALIFPFTYNYLLFLETNLPTGQVYHFDELLTDLESGIWKELKDHKEVDLHRRYLQKTYVYELVHNGIRLNKYTDYGRTDYCEIINKHIRIVSQKIKSALPGYTDPVSKSHLSGLLITLTQSLNFQKNNFPENPVSVTGTPRKPVSESFNFEEIKLFSHDQFLNQPKKTENCWQYKDFWRDMEELNLDRQK